MTLTGNGCSESSAECIDDGRVPASSLAGFFEGLLHEDLCIVSKQGVFLVLSERIVSSAKKIFGDFTVTIWLLVSARR